MIHVNRKTLPLLTLIGLWAVPAGADPSAPDERPGVVRCAMVTYGKDGKGARCFAPHFMKDVQAKTRIWTAEAFDLVRLDDKALFGYPFAVLSGEGAFELSELRHPPNLVNTRFGMMHRGVISFSFCILRNWVGWMPHFCSSSISRPETCQR